VLRPLSPTPRNLKNTSKLSTKFNVYNFNLHVDIKIRIKWVLLRCHKKRCSFFCQIYKMGFSRDILTAAMSSFGVYLFFLYKHKREADC
jgi:hypothetical protein